MRLPPGAGPRASLPGPSARPGGTSLIYILRPERPMESHDSPPCPRGAGAGRRPAALGRCGGSLGAGGDRARRPAHREDRRRPAEDRTRAHGVRQEDRGRAHRPDRGPDPGASRRSARGGAPGRRPRGHPPALRPGLHGSTRPDARARLRSGDRTDRAGPGTGRARGRTGNGRSTRADHDLDRRRPDSQSPRVRHALAHHRPAARSAWCPARVDRAGDERPPGPRGHAHRPLDAREWSRCAHGLLAVAHRPVQAARRLAGRGRHRHRIR